MFSFFYPKKNLAPEKKDSDDHAIDVNQDPPEALPEPPSTKMSRPLYYFFNGYTLLFSSVIDVLQYFIGLKDINGDLLGFIPLSVTISWMLAFFYLVETIALNLQFVPHGINTMYALMKHEKQDEWEEISKINSCMALFLSMMIIVMASLFDLLATAYYLETQETSKNRPINFVIGGLVSIANLPTEGMETMLWAHRIFSTQKNEERDVVQTTLWDIPLIVVKKFLITAGAIEDWIESYITAMALAKIILNWSSPAFKYCVLILGFFNGLVDTMFNGKNSSLAIDQFLAKLADYKNLNFKNLLTFFLALFTALTVGHTQGCLIYNLLKEPAATLPDPLPPTLPDSLCFAFAWSIAIRETTNYTYYLCHTFFPIIDAGLNKIGCGQPTEPEQKLLARTETLSPSSQGRLFPAPSPKKPTNLFPAPEANNMGFKK